ncbi:chromosome partitioning protein ParA [Frankia sp. CcI49]|uniref:ParA family protein n=1 Tax=Frankia sp. CcI49 TaxID=1745382 RepID=UPI000975A5D4|nr:ParA family protein [Frankia sp. CcI49]ONH59341.1 chromosome partitioning protein ParA [Frankia sp. CcI49]
MKVVTIASYKGGVGKTTLTANLGAAIARLGRRVLLIDLDPQTNLTFNFYGADQWRRDLADQRRTVKAWFESWRPGTPPPPLAGYVTSPPVAQAVVAEGGGTLDLLASHLALGDIEMALVGHLGGAQAHRSTRYYFEVYQQLAAGLAALSPTDYDLVLIDCPSHFGVITRAAVAACDYLLIPSRPDNQSTVGVEHLMARLGRFVWEYNRVAELQSGIHQAVKPLEPRLLGVVLTMVQYYRGSPTSFLRPHIERAEGLGIPIFSSMLRVNNRGFAGVAGTPLPAVLSPDLTPELARELLDLVEEFLLRMGAAGRGAARVCDDAVPVTSDWKR